MLRFSPLVYMDPVGMTVHTNISCNEDSDRFPALGYCLFRNVISPEEVARYSRMLEEMLVSGTWKGEPHFYFDEWRKLCCNPRILDAVSSVLGPELVLFYSSIFMKRPRDQMRTPWHQDNTYWDSIRGTDVVTAWLALDNVDEENSCMKVIPCSHAGYEGFRMQAVEMKPEDRVMLRKEVDVTSEMEAAAVPIVLQAGEISIHDSFVIHGSGPNFSDRRRAGYTIRYGNALTTEIDQAIHTHSDHPRVPVYYVRGEGDGLREGYVDLRA